jgi:polyferredoxin
MEDNRYIDAEEETYRDKIATVDDQGKRVWVYPKQPQGRYYQWRTYLSFAFLLVLFGLPWIKVNGMPLVMLNVLERRFILFGLHFAPQDFYLFVLAMIIFIVFIALFTVVFGRVFCGWVCPQTIFMEMVFRKLEYWIEGDANAQKRLNKAPWTPDKLWKKSAKHALFFAIAILVANTFLAYIIGTDELLGIITEPLALHWGGFLSMVLFSFAFYFVFASLREQVCVTICPYGRLQSVLLDENSIVIHYDHIRGEPRGKITKTKPLKAKPAEESGKCSGCSGDGCKGSASLANVVPQLELGDCIDCTLCVQVCPTGIDIRNGTQLECVNCTACIDACDNVMDKVGRPRGLIRYDSYNGVVNKQKKLFTPRVIAYSVVLVALLGLEIGLFASRTTVETLLLRTPGLLYQEVDENTLSNLYNYQIMNKTSDTLSIQLVLPEKWGGRIKWVGEPPRVLPNSQAEGAVFIELPKDQLDGRKNKLRLRVTDGEKEIGTTKTNFLAPI